MRRWLKRIGLVFVLVATVLALGNLEAAALALLLVSFARHGDHALSTKLKLALVSIWLAGFVVAGAVGYVVLGHQTPTRQRVILRLYDLNCSAPFKTFRYPYSVRRLAEGQTDDDWRAVITCGS